MNQNQSCKRYRRALKKHLFCGGRERKHLVAQFDEILSQVLGDTPDPDYKTLCASMGTPVELAEELMREVPSEAISQWKRQRRLVLVLACLVCVTLVVACGVMAWKVTHREPITIYQQTFVSYPDEPEDKFVKRRDDFIARWNEKLDEMEEPE